MDQESPGGAVPKRKLRLDQFLKFVGAFGTGGQAKHAIQSGEVRLNGEVETRRGHGLSPGDRVETGGRVWTVGPELWEEEADGGGA